MIVLIVEILVYPVEDLEHLSFTVFSYTLSDTHMRSDTGFEFSEILFLRLYRNMTILKNIKKMIDDVSKCLELWRIGSPESY